VSLLLAGPATADTTTSPSTTAQLLGDYAVAPPTDLDTAAEVVTSRAAGGRLAVGDSLMVGATSLMRRQGFAIHARVGRQFSTAPGIVSGYGTRLPRNVVIELGTNGTISLAACRRVVRLAGPERRVFLVTNRVPRSWQDPNNATLRRCDRSFARSRVRLIDWHGASAGHTEWFAADGVHTSAAGRLAFARLIDRTVDRHGR
jgi:lysophospholipase L1-like esterase